MDLTSTSADPVILRVKKSDRSLGVLVVDEEVPFPLTNGKRIRTYNLLRHLAAKHRTTFLCHPNRVDAERDLAVGQFEQLGIKVEFLNRNLPKQTMLTPRAQLAAQLGLNLVSKYPYFVQKHVSQELRQRVAQISERPEIDLIHFEWTPYAAAITRRICKPWVVAAHNVESLLWERYARVEANPLKQRYIKYQWKKLRHFETKVFQDASQVIFVSVPDGEIAKKDFGCASRAVVDNGVDLDEYRYVDVSSRDSNRILFVGSLDWRPNVDGLEFFLGEVWPQLRAKRLNLHLDIVGRKPNRRFVERVNQEENVTLHADVARVQPYLEHARMMIVPLRIGGGSRLKILEAASSGLPVVSTAVGAEGLLMAAGRHFIEAESTDDFVGAILNNLDNKPYLNNIAYTARKLVEGQYDWSQLACKLDHVWRRAVARSCGK